MLAIFCILIFLLISFLSYKKTHSIIHPAVIVSLSWGGLLFVYRYFDHGLYELSDKFYKAILLWVTVFCGSALWFYRKKIKFSSPIYTSSLKTVLLKRLTYISLVINIIGIYEYYSLSGGIAYNALVAMTREEVELPLTIRILQLFQVFSTVLYAVLMLYGKHIDIPRKWIVLYVITIFVWAGIAANKTGLFQLVAISVVIAYLKQKLSITKIILSFTILLVSFLVLQNMRAKSVGGKEESMEDIVLTYVLSPMPAFDMVLNGEKEFSPGRTWRFFLAVANKSGLVEKSNDKDDSGWVNVPVLTNVYTVMFPYYVDFGYWGIFIFALILGGGWGILYGEMMRGTPLFVVIYAVLTHSLLLQFFADYIVNYLSMVLQIIIFCSILILHYKIKVSR